MDPRPRWFTKELWMNLHSRLQKSSTPCSPILAQPSPCRTFRSDEDTTSSSDTLLLAWTSGICQGLLKIVYHLFPHQTCVPQTLWTPQTASDSSKALESISMDFIEKLPPSSSYTSILVIVDCLSKQSLFIPTDDTIMSPQLAQLFVLHIFPSMVFQAMSPQTAVRNLSPIFFVCLERHAI